MSIYATDSGIAVTSVRVSNFRSLGNIEVELGDLTVLIGANNAGKTSFLDALYAAIGAGRKALTSDDIRLLKGEALAPKERMVTVDIRVHPINADGKKAASFPEGSFWTALWGSSIVLDTELDEFIAFRTTLSWNVVKADYVIERKPLGEWRDFSADWLSAPVGDKSVSAAQLEPIALHYIDAKRDLDEDLRKQGSFWRRMTDDLGLPGEDIAGLEDALTAINQQIIDKSEVLQHLKENLASLQGVVSADSAGIDIAPVARKLRDLSKGVDVSFSTKDAQSFPLARHGMGTRSLASLLVFRAFAAWRNLKAKEGGDKLHCVLALEEPEAHLHPQAQRSLFSHIKEITGQRVVSTHSPYFAGQAKLEDLRLFIKSSGTTTATKLSLTDLSNKDDIRKLQDTVIDSRGDLLFSNAVVFFEGQTEEQALPIWAQAYWGASIHELGFTFVRANGTDYFPLIWLAKSLQIPWFIFADGEAMPLSKLEEALKKAKCNLSSQCSNVVVLPDGCNFETHLIAHNYLGEVEIAMNELFNSENALDGFIEKNHGLAYPKNKGGNRDYKSENGRERAARDAMASAKTKLARPLARAISNLEDKERRFPPGIRVLFDIIAEHQGLPQRTSDNKKEEEE